MKPLLVCLLLAVLLHTATFVRAAQSTFLIIFIDAIVPFSRKVNCNDFTCFRNVFAANIGSMASRSTDHKKSSQRQPED